MWLSSLWSWFLSGIWKSLETQTMGDPRCFRQSLMGHSDGSWDVQTMEMHRKMYNTIKTIKEKKRHTVLEGNKDSIWKLVSPHLCFILTVNLYTFSHILGKRMRLNSHKMHWLAEEITKKGSFRRFGGYLMWEVMYTMNMFHCHWLLKTLLSANGLTE